MSEYTDKASYSVYLYPNDNADVIATKKQFAKRQAFGALNVPMSNPGVYVIHTIEHILTKADPLDTFVYYLYTFEIHFRAWGVNNGATNDTDTGKV